ncbi:MAG: LAGLIDADG family homing endonuclease [Elusimicrobia bacterium]|nr:LAGLIDADG family homing endonuclease [Elusimicrobiota bacterium]
MSADNQQERSDGIQSSYITGFVDGEGCFSITIQKSKNVKLGIQVIPEFHVSQHSSRTEVLEAIKRKWNCGYIKENDRNNPKDMTSVYVVRNINDIRNKVIPFFDRYPIYSSKKQDFKKFKIVVEMMKSREHLKKEGLINILKIAFSMNANGKYRKLKLENIVSFLESSETIR